MHFPTIAIAALMASGASAYRMTLWSGTSYTGQAVAYTSSGSHSLGFSANSYKWESTVGDGCCAVFCYKNKNVGNWCSAKNQPGSSSPIDKVVLGCGDQVLNC